MADEMLTVMPDLPAWLSGFENAAKLALRGKHMIHLRPSRGRRTLRPSADRLNHVNVSERLSRMLESTSDTPRPDLFRGSASAIPPRPRQKGGVGAGTETDLSPLDP